MPFVFHGFHSVYILPKKELFSSIFIFKMLNLVYSNSGQCMVDPWTHPFASFLIRVFLGIPDLGFIGKWINCKTLRF